MNQLDQLRLDLKKMVAKNLGIVFQQLDKVLDNRSAERYNQFIALSAEFNRWKEDQFSGVQSNSELNQRSAALTMRLLNFIDLLSDNDIKTNYHLNEEIHECILVVCKTPERVEYMKGFFPKSHFVNLNFATDGAKDKAENYDIVLFDNFPHDSDEGKHELLKFYMDEATPAVLYFGSFLPMLNSYPEKVYATNSVFSLHARIDEMIKYLKYKRTTDQPGNHHS